MRHIFGMHTDLQKSLLGRTLTEIKVRDKETIFFTRDDGKVFRMYHPQDCCESVELDDICGDLQDLLNSPLLMVEEVTHSGEDPMGPFIPERMSNASESWTWTFYKFGTAKGYVTIRWIGESNGYYSESVDFEEEKNG